MFKSEYKSEFETESLGKLYIFPLTAKDGLEIYQYFGKGTQAEEFIYYLMSIVCYQEDALIDGKSRPENQTLTTDSFRNLKESEIEEFCEKFLEANDDLYTEMIVTYEKEEEKPGTRVKISKGGIEFPKNEGESNIKYIYRLFELKHEKDKKRAERTMKSLNFSNPVQNQILKTLNMGNMLLGNMNLNKIREAEIIPITHELPRIDFAEIEKNKEEARLAPYREMSEKLDEVNKNLSDSVGFMVLMNQTQTQIAQEIKSSGDATQKTSDATLKAANWTLLLTIIILIFTALGVYIGWLSLKVSSNSNFNNVFKEYADSNNHQLNEIIKQQSNIINELKDSRLQEKRRLDLLEQQLKKNNPKGKL